MAVLDQTTSESSTESYLSSISVLSPSTYDSASQKSSSSQYTWNISARCQPLIPTFQYLSSKLAFQGLHVAIIVLNTRPQLLSAWPIDIHTQHFLGKLISRADVKYSLDEKWINALEDLCQPVNAGQAFETFRTSTYLIHRSSLQKDIIFSGEGLTVMAVDYVYKFKEQLVCLAQEMTFPLFREDCKTACVELLRHINTIYTDIPMTKAYLKRSYTQLCINDEILDEVCESYHAMHGEDLTTTMGTTTTTHGIIPLKLDQDKPFPNINYLQESPRKLPVPPKNPNPQPYSFSARAALQPPTSLHKSGLGTPFEFDPYLSRPLADAVTRPKSPKGELFESPRSAPTTPRRTPSAAAAVDARSHDHPMPSYQQQFSIDAVPPLKLKNTETSSILSGRKKRLGLPSFGLARSASTASATTNKAWGETSSMHSTASKSFSIRRGVERLVMGPRPGPPPSVQGSRCASLMRGDEGGGLAGYDVVVTGGSGSGSGHMPTRGVHGRFGWLSVVRRRKGEHSVPSLIQRVF